MKHSSQRLLLTLLTGLATFCGGSVRADLYVLQVGADGAASAPTGSSTAGFVKQYSDLGEFASTIDLPTAEAEGIRPITFSGSATSEGFLKLSTNGQFLTFGGYAIAPGTPGIANSTTLSAPRTVGRVEISTGAVNTTTALSGDNAFSGSNIRSVVSTDGTAFWIAGSGSNTTGGLRYATLGSDTSVMLTDAAGATLSNARVAGIFDGQLYVSSSSAPSGNNFRGVLSVGTGLPTEAQQEVTLLMPPVDNRSSYDFWFKDAQTLYIADDSNAAGGGGIQKWTFDDTEMNWSLAYTLLNTGSATTAVRGLSGKVAGDETILYATTAQTHTNSLISVVDTGAEASATTLATAPANTVFRGVAYVPSDGPVVDADFNGDQVVDGADLLIWQRNYLTGTLQSEGDADGNGAVDAADLAAWQSAYPLAESSGSLAAVPEPGAAALAAVALVAVATRGRRRRG